jgi:hypothetical protein
MGRKLELGETMREGDIVSFIGFDRRVGKDEIGCEYCNPIVDIIRPDKSVAVPETDLSVINLRKNGWKVSVFHHRVRKDKIVQPRGGATLVICRKGDETKMGLAKVNPSDNYQRKYGVKLALERAFSESPAELTKAVTYLAFELNRKG